LNDFNIWLSSFLACCLVKDYFLFLVGAVNLGGSVPQAKSFFAVRKITGTKKNKFLLVRRLAVSPCPASFGLAATRGQDCKCSTYVPSYTEPTDKSKNYLPLH
jgi:hypothetical protein